MEFKDLKKFNIFDKYMSRKVQLTTVIFIGIFIILLFINSAQVRQFKALRTQADQIGDELATLKALINKGPSMAVGLRKLQQEFDLLKAKFPAAEHETIKELTRYAEKYKLAIESISPSQEREFVDASGKPFGIGADTFKQADFIVKAKGTYRDVGNYVGLLTKNFPLLVTVESIDLTRPREDEEKLNARIDVMTYSLTPKFE